MVPLRRWLRPAPGNTKLPRARWAVLAKQPPLRAGDGSGGGSRRDWGQRDGEPQGFELPDSSALFALRILFEEVVATEFGEDRFRIGQQMPNNRQDGVGHGHRGALVPTTSAQALELGGQVGIQAMGSKPRRLRPARPAARVDPYGSCRCAVCRRSSCCPDTNRPKTPGAWQSEKG